MKELIPKQAIEKAMRGGWKPDAEIDEAVRAFLKGLAGLYKPEYAYIALDPTFWKALSKALGWETQDGFNQSAYRGSGAAGEMPVGLYEWHQNGIRLCEFILAGRSTEKFWANILK